MRSALVGLLVVFGFSLPPVAVAVWPVEGGTVAVIARDDAGALLAESGARVVGLSQSRRVAFLRAAPDTADLPRRLREAGAAIVLAAPDDLSCLAQPSERTSPLIGKTTR